LLTVMFLKPPRLEVPELDAIAVGAEMQLVIGDVSRRRSPGVALEADGVVLAVDNAVEIVTFFRRCR